MQDFQRVRRILSRLTSVVKMLGEADSVAVSRVGRAGGGESDGIGVVVHVGFAEETGRRRVECSRCHRSGVGRLMEWRSLVFGFWFGSEAILMSRGGRISVSLRF
jgi:hypothetical protein